MRCDVEGRVYACVRACGSKIRGPVSQTTARTKVPPALARDPLEEGKLGSRGFSAL